MNSDQCVFCQIIAGDLPSYLVYEDEHAVAFLDSHPLFPGHVLLCPRAHYETLLDLPQRLNGTMLTTTQLLARAVEAAVDAEGTFIAMNNYVSQTVPHLHIHIVPRRRRDGLKGFFWPRQNYKDDQAREAVRNAIEREVAKIRREED
ncbi:MAG: HIT family protein [Acidobacteriaceae bacterium]|nr:HIT family protein [Acidobacteriaceae bacterium]